MKKLYLFFLLSFFTFEVIIAQTSIIRVNFSCPGQVTVTYDLKANCATDVVLYYSHNKQNWLPATTVTGDLTAQTSDTDKTIIWDNVADNVKFGKFYFKVEISKTIICGCTVNSTLRTPPYNGKLTFLCYNLGANENMTIEEQMAYIPQGSTDPTVYGDLYQWGRKTDGHEKRTSANYPTNNTSIENGEVSGIGNFDANGQIVNTHAAYGKFIKQSVSPRDWRSPQIDTLWNSGTETLPVKTANDPCPKGWRLPTHTEWASIHGGTSGNTWTWNSSGTTGFKITPTGSTEPSLFLPAAGDRNYEVGAVRYVDTYGGYWSCSVSGTYSSYLSFVSSSMGFAYGILGRANGFSLRCVAEL